METHYLPFGSFLGGLGSGDWRAWRSQGRLAGGHPASTVTFPEGFRKMTALIEEPRRFLPL